METEERYTLNTGDVDVYALYPWKRQSKRHPPRLLPPPLAPGAERETQALQSRAVSGEGGRVGGACCYDGRCSCCCLGLQLESAEAAVEPEPILEE